MPLLTRPIPIGFGILLWFYDTGNEGILIFFLTKPPGDVTIEFIKADHFLALIGDMGGHGRQLI
jgi:hypothetical protein